MFIQRPQVLRYLVDVVVGVGKVCGKIFFIFERNISLPSSDWLHIPSTYMTINLGNNYGDGWKYITLISHPS